MTDTVIFALVPPSARADEEPRSRIETSSNALRNYFSLVRRDFEPTAKVTIYHAQPYSHRDPLRQLIEPDFYIDVSGVIDRKLEMLAMHVSQKNWLDESQGHDSYLQTLKELDGEWIQRPTLQRNA